MAAALFAATGVGCSVEGTKLKPPDDCTPRPSVDLGPESKASRRPQEEGSSLDLCRPEMVSRKLEEMLRSGDIEGLMELYEVDAVSADFDGQSVGLDQVRVASVRKSSVAGRMAVGSSSSTTRMGRRSWNSSRRDSYRDAHEYSHGRVCPETPMRGLFGGVSQLARFARCRPMGSWCPPDAG